MTFNDLKEIFEGTTPKAMKYETWKFVELAKKVKVNIEMDRKTLDYYYSIAVDDILNSEMTKEDINALKEDGWSFNQHKESLLLYCLI